MIFAALASNIHTASVNMVSKSPAGLGGQLCAVYFATTVLIQYLYSTYTVLIQYLHIVSVVFQITILWLLTF